jgi:hypothetical protein
MEEENYFFVIEDNDKNRLPSLQGTWKLYCSEVGFGNVPIFDSPTLPPSISDSVLIVQGQFTSDQNGGFEYNNGEPIIVDNTGGQPFQSFIIVIETIGYKKALSFGTVNQIDRNDPTTRGVYTAKNYKIQLLTESQYIEERISNIKDTLENRIMAA